tara:strand:+ start:834 stop:1160 length:327 start_codon:yes stop_codon:yes gene_type:complete
MSDTETEPPVAVPEVAVPKTKKARKKAAKKVKVVPQPQPEPEPEPEPVKVNDKKTKMTDDQKSSLREHMLAQHADGKMTVSEGKSMRMKLMSRMRKGMTLEEARKDIA